MVLVGKHPAQHVAGHLHRQEHTGAVLLGDPLRREPTDHTEPHRRPATLSIRSAGTPGRIRATLSRNHDDEPVQPTRSAITVAGMSGVSATRPRTLASTAANDVGTDRRPYVGRPSAFAASITVVREMPNRRAIAACGTPSAASLLISVQSSLVITLPIVSGWSLFTGETVQFSGGVDMPSSSFRR